MSTSKDYTFWKISTVREHVSEAQLQEKMQAYMYRFEIKSIAGLSAYLRARTWTYYDVIKWFYEF